MKGQARACSSRWKCRPRRTDIDTKTRNVLLRSLRYQGNAASRSCPSDGAPCGKSRVSPTTIGDIAKSVLVLMQFEHKMIS